MEDKVFGALMYDDDGYWIADRQIKFGENTFFVEIIIFGDDTDVTEAQRDVYVQLMNGWSDIREKLIDKLLAYYNNQERFSYGPKNWWPEINTKDELLQAIELETIVIPEDFLLKNERRAYLLFSRSWGGDDIDDNGIGVCLVNEEIYDIGYKDIAF